MIHYLWRPMSIVPIVCIWSFMLCNGTIAATTTADTSTTTTATKPGNTTTLTTTTTATAATITAQGTTTVTVWAPTSRDKLQAAIIECLKLSPTDCSKGPHGPIGSWDVSAVTDTSWLFVDASRHPFPGANKFNGDLSKWDVSSVTNMYNMFNSASSFNGDLSKWDVSSVQGMRAMFDKASSFNGDLSKWDVSGATAKGGLAFMFNKVSLFNGDLSKWDVSRVKNMYATFKSASFFNGDLSKWDVSGVVTNGGMKSMFNAASSFNGDLSKWDVSKVMFMNTMFQSASSFNSDLSKWDVSSVKNMEAMFQSAESFNGDLSKWDVSRVANMKAMFRDASSFAQTLCGVWVTLKAKKPANMFDGSSGRICTTTDETNSTDLTIATTDVPATDSELDGDFLPITVIVAVLGIAGLVILVAVVVVLVLQKGRRKSGSEDQMVEMSANNAIVDTRVQGAGTDPVSSPVRIDLSTVTVEIRTSRRDGDEPPLSPSCASRTFENSNYKRFYVQAVSPPFQHDLLQAVNDMLALFARRINPTLDEEAVEAGVHAFMKKIQGDAFKDNEALQNDVDAVAEYLWTSTPKHRIVKNMELCSVMNAVIRDDFPNEIAAAVMIFRSINQRRVNRVSHGATLDVQSYPPKGETWRGGGFRDEFKPFFQRIKGKKFRVPGFLATSDDKQVASGFAFKANKAHPTAMWRVTFDKRGKDNPEYRVQHMSFVSKTLVDGEGEYLFAPYSVFTLVSVKWSTRRNAPHRFTIRAAVDNREEDENLPLAPWY